MKAWGRLAVLACAATCVLAIPAGAAAKPGYVVEPERFSLSARLPKSNGYSVHLGSVGHRWIELAVHRRGQLAIYMAKGRVNRHGIDVDFGRFGRVRADFTGRQMKSEPLFPGCDGRPAIKARGRLEGSFRFRGEGGFVNVSTMRAKASYERSFRLVCYFGPESARDREMVDVLEATGKAAGRRVYFRRRTFPPSAHR